MVTTRGSKKTRGDKTPVDEDLARELAAIAAANEARKMDIDKIDQTLPPSPIKPAGTKRNAKTPDRSDAPPQAAQDTTTEERTDTSHNISPVNLDEKLAHALGQFTTTPAEARALIRNDATQGKEFTDKIILDELMNKEGWLKPLEEVSGYQFSSDKESWNILCRINYRKVAERLKQRVQIASDEPTAACHPDYGPFTFHMSTMSSQSFEIRNKQDQIAMTFKLEEFKLDTEEYVFQLDDPVTYVNLCRYNLPSLLASLRDLHTTGSNPLAHHQNGPFYLGEFKDDPDVLELFCASGAVGRFPPASYTARFQEWVQVQRLKTTKVGFASNLTSSQPAKGTTPPSNTNRYSALSDNSGQSPSNISTITQKDRSGPSQTSTPSATTKSTKKKKVVEIRDSSSDDESDSTGESSNSSTTSDDKKKKKKRRARRKKGKNRNPDEDDGDNGKNDDGKANDENDDMSTLALFIEAGDTEMQGNESDGEAACTDNEQEFDRRPSTDPPVYSSSRDSHETTVNPTNDSPAPSSIFPLDGDQHIVSLRIELSPKKDNRSRLLEGVSQFLQQIQTIDSNAAILPRIHREQNPYPPLTSTDKNKFPTSYAMIRNYIQCTNTWVISQLTVDSKTLQRRLAAQSPGSSSKRDKKNSSNRSGPTSLFVHLNLKSDLSDFAEVLDSLNVDMICDLKIKATLKNLQCWDSDVNVALIGVNNGLDALGVQITLEHHLKEIEKQLCRRGERDMMEYYDLDLPPFHVYLHRLKDKVRGDDMKELSFSKFPFQVQLAYHIEASPTAWARLDPLIDLMIRTKRLVQVFGPVAYFLYLPTNKPSLSEIRDYQKKCGIGMGYNLRTSIMECNEVQTFDYEVRVRLKEQPVMDPTTGLPTGETTVPPPPFRKTSLRHELSLIQLNEVRVFHTAILTVNGADRGTSRFVVPYEPNSAVAKEVQLFARRTLTNLAGFMYHWLSDVRQYCPSTVKRLMQSFYIDKAACAELSIWDPITKTATSDFGGPDDSWLDDHLAYHPTLKAEKTPEISYEISTAAKESLLKTLNYNSEKTCDDVNSRISGLTGASNATMNTAASDNTANRALTGNSMAMKLALANKDSAEKQQQIQEMQRQIQLLHDTIAASQAAGSPPLSGSGPPTVEKTAGEGPQGP